jgi:molecular chaperone DnaK
VTFDIDADGIVNVSAKDKATNKDQSITIAASSGLSKDEIANMVEQAEQHAEADKERKETIEAVNHAESVIHDTEKAMTDFKDQLDSAEAEKLREKIKDLRERLVAAAGDESSVKGEDLRTQTGELQQISLKLFELVYKNRAQQNENTSSSSDASGAKEAEYTDVNDKKQ